VNTAPYSAAASVALTGQQASIPLTALVGLPSTGVYRISWRIRVTQAATTSSSIQLVITTTEGGVVCTQQSAAYTGNATNAPQSGLFVVRPDGDIPIEFSTVYASVGATPMKHDLDLVVESL
jgi:hypothetical protein